MEGSALQETPIFLLNSSYHKSQNLKIDKYFFLKKDETHVNDFYYKICFSTMKTAFWSTLLIAVKCFGQCLAHLCPAKHHSFNKLF